MSAHALIQTDANDATVKVNYVGGQWQLSITDGNCTTNLYADSWNDLLQFSVALRGAIVGAVEADQ